MSDFPSMVMLVIAAYFIVKRALQRPSWEEGAFAGLFAGFAIGIKPSSSLFLAGVALAFLAARRWRSAAAFAAGIAPCLIALTVWKWRGLGYVPLFHAQHSVRVAAASVLAVPLGGLNLGNYIHLDWSQFGGNLGSLQEHFWSKRVIEWLVIAGILAMARRSVALGLFVGGWFLAFTIVKGPEPVPGTSRTGASCACFCRRRRHSSSCSPRSRFSFPVRRNGWAPRHRPGRGQRSACEQRCSLAGFAVFAVVPAAVACSREASGAFFLFGVLGAGRPDPDRQRLRDQRGAGARGSPPHLDCSPCRRCADLLPGAPPTGGPGSRRARLHHRPGPPPLPTKSPGRTPIGSRSRRTGSTTLPRATAM